MTDHSIAYTEFYRQLNADGMERAYGGYSPDTLDEIFDWERDEVEKAVWTNFNSTCDGDLAVLVSKLQLYDGIEALNEKLRDAISTNEYSLRMVFIACAAYEAALTDDYLDYVFEYYDKKKDNSALAALSYLKPCDKLYDFFKAVYIYSDDSTARSAAVDGMLSAKGYIKDPKDFQERSELTGMARAFMSDDHELRQKKLSRFENGDFDSIPRTYGLYRKLSYEEAIRQARENKLQEDPGELVAGMIDAAESGNFIVYYEPENMYIPAVPSGILDAKPAIGDKVLVLMKKKGQSLIMRIIADC